MTRLLAATALVLLLAATVFAADRRPPRPRPYEPAIHGAVVGAAKTEVDTVYVLGGPDRLDGSFEDAAGNPTWHGWTHHDLTAYDPSEYWHVSDFMAPAGQYAMWCGTDFDGDPGYGNAWNQSLVFTHAVADPAAESTVAWTATLQIDTEPAYDFTYVEVNRGGEWETLEFHDGERVLAVNQTVVFAAGDYVGENTDEIQLRVRFESDGAWSDEDGLFDTDGACQLDDVSVTVDGVLVDFEDFEDQVSDRWYLVLEPGVGDFAALWTDLCDLDPCKSNHSAQVAFIDDGIVVPGTGGSHCITWCYGPGGYIVNNTGGLMGPEHYLNNRVESPVLEWPEGCEAAELRFDTYRHEGFAPFDQWPGIGIKWGVRSTSTPGNIDAAPYQDRDSGIFFGGPDYLRRHQIVSDLLESDRVQVQLRFDCWQWGYYFGMTGTDGTPAPYLDNVALVAWPFAGPQLRARTIDLFNDNFPASGTLDLANLAANSVRLDAAQNVAQQDDLVNYPGDSIWVDIDAIRAGAVLDDLPKLQVRMKANPLFDGVRVLPPNFSQSGQIVSGWVYGDSTYNANGGIIADRYNFDLPDTGFFYPGDVLHYFIEARDNLAGDIGTAQMPGDTTGFNDFEGLRYHQDFRVRALPTVWSTTPGDQPAILFWQDAIDRGGHDEWYFALAQLGLRRGLDYDMYANNGPSSGVGNGLGGRATADLLAGYATLLYSSANLTVNLLANGDYGDDPSRDLQVLDGWFAHGDKNAFMTGDDLVTGLLEAGNLGAAFVDDYLGVSWAGESVREFIGDQIAPDVRAVAGNGIINVADRWTGWGGCPRPATFDAVEALAGTSALAEFTDPDGNPGGYPYAAAAYHVNATESARVVLMPYDLSTIRNAQGWTPPVPAVTARAYILGDVLEFFGHPSSVVAVAPDAPLRVTQYPNPFNPTTTIALDLPRTGDVSLKIYDLRGALVRTLVDEHLAAGHHEIEWNGTDHRGAAVASGVYFAEVRAAGEVKVQKLALVK